MRWLIFGIVDVGILSVFLVESSFAKFEAKNAKKFSEETYFKNQKKDLNQKKSAIVEADNYMYYDDKFLYACDKNNPDSICKCEIETLNCEKQDLKNPNVYVRDEAFIVKYANFKNNGIKVLRNKEILPGINYEIEVLDFSDNFISKIEAKCFDGFQNLKKLYLSSNRLKTINNGFLTKRIGGSLHQLFLNDNQITEIYPSAFQELINLKILVLDGNVGINLNKNTFSTALANLETLSLDGCKISEFDDNIFERLGSLQQLSLRNNPILMIPKAINAIPNLFGLDLSNTEISELWTDKISADHNLTEIYLSNMPYLYGIYDCAFCGLPNLKKIILSKNPQLYFIHENSFGAVTKQKDSKFSIAELKEFDISECNFENLPKNLLDWTKIENLNIHGNSFNCSTDLEWLTKNPCIHFAINPKCANPASMKGRYFSSIPKISVNCDGTISNGPFSHASSVYFRVMWAMALFLTVIGFLILSGLLYYYIRRIRGTNCIYRRKVLYLGYNDLPTEQLQQHQQDEKLFI